MTNSYVYRVFQSTWGIYVGLTANMFPHSKFAGEAVETISDVYLSIGIPNISREEYEYFVIGINLVKDQLEPWISKNEPVVISIVDLVINFVDYQPEGLACALAGWLAERLQLEYTQPTVYFDKDKNRYIFPFAASTD